MAVQPMKAASAAMLIEPMNPSAIAGAGLVIGAFFLLLGVTGVVGRIARVLPPTIAAGLDAKSSFVEVLDRGEEDQLTHCVGKAEQALTCTAAHRLDGRTREVHAEEVDHQRRETIQWHELKGGEIDDDGGDPIAVYMLAR